MALEDLSDSELGRIVREGALWPILLEMEKKNEEKAATDSRSAAGKQYVQQSHS